ncbi:hypothetical protein RSOLAG1IB_06312 [Rhizoctonia solani AG-1 IB]|uniref:Uncharacterized protein n=1 Tax=Thanatephorus cucumeris (strain AG1-IB / isolate 7/3/14) TaxID=1108050 RepID=A0A0B7F717_THACB|nr:hypothetical protein RSOLAG1IB_06312 [Rhizoctonia solani AG-1 IB]
MDPFCGVRGIWMSSTLLLGASFASANFSSPTHKSDQKFFIKIATSQPFNSTSSSLVLNLLVSFRHQESTSLYFAFSTDQLLGYRPD